MRFFSNDSFGFLRRIHVRSNHFEIIRSINRPYKMSFSRLAMAVEDVLNFLH